MGRTNAISSLIFIVILGMGLSSRILALCSFRLFRMPWSRSRFTALGRHRLFCDQNSEPMGESDRSAPRPISVK